MSEEDEGAKGFFHALHFSCHCGKKGKLYKFLRVLCCVKRREKHSGVHIFGTFCGHPHECCTKQGYTTCILSPGGRLWLSFFIAFIWLWVGGLSFHLIEPETFVTIDESVYFCVITMATIGYGDITPVTSQGRIWNFFYAHIGIIIFGIFSTFLVQEFFSCLACNPSNKKIQKNRWRIFAARYRPLFVVVFYIIVLLIGATIFSYTESIRSNTKITDPEEENKTQLYGFSQGFYFSWVTATTLGYGDVTVNGQVGRILVEFYAIFGIAMLGLLLTQTSALKVDAELYLRHRRRVRKQGEISYVIPNNVPDEVKELLEKTLSSYCDLKERNRTCFLENFEKLTKGLKHEEIKDVVSGEDS